MFLIVGYTNISIFIQFHWSHGCPGYFVLSVLILDIMVLKSFLDSFSTISNLFDIDLVFNIHSWSSSLASNESLLGRACYTSLERGI